MAPVPREVARRLGKLIKVNYGELVDAMFHRKIPAAVNYALILTTTHYTCS